MPREMSSAMLAAIGGREIAVAIFVEATFANETVRVWTGHQSIDWNGHTWVGVGTMGSISPIGEDAAVEAKGVTLTFSGFDAGLLGDVMEQFVVGQPVTVYLGLFNAGVLIASPITSWAGRLDQATVDVGVEASISINCESRLLDMNVAVDRRYTADDQQRDWPGDLGFTFVNAIQEMTLYWGTAPTSAGNI